MGKTTLARQLLTHISQPGYFLSADAVPDSSHSWLEQQWEAARQRLLHSGAPFALLVIDEIQKVPNWPEAVKAQWDADTWNNVPLKVVLLGSSRLLLQQGLTESLMGRYELTYLGHWQFREMEAAFGLSAAEYVWYGGYPGAAQLIGDEQRWKSYIRDAIIEPSISRDILMLNRVDKPALLRRVFELGCLYSGQIVSYSKLLGQLQDAGNTTTLAHYLELLDTAGLLGGLAKYGGGLIRQRASSPKFQVHNLALLTALHPALLEEAQQQPELWGRLVESAVGTHLLNAARQQHLQLWYWREGNDEVDFILEHRGLTIALEVKSGAAGSRRGLEIFRKRFQPHKVLITGSSGLPWDELLRIDPAGLF
ncbi:MAG: ATP-binding protein [Bacteroidia bacterium]|nr:ATP-binding protein [Bacteroidia bacterium]